ncbi:MAG TPA: hypothetical protein VMF90_12420 [Rhizobiaceae bacterium]|nr:hypothetical protein [Rhizobiaceae bacterium]
MALTYPLDFLLDFPGWSTRFELMRRQEQSRQADGITLVKDMGDPLWIASYQSRTLFPNELDRWRATLQALENGLQQFKGRPLSRCYPILYPNGTWPTGGGFDGTNASLDFVGANRSLIRVEDLPEGFVLSVGDYLQIGDADLHQVVEQATSNSSNLTAIFQVTPHMWPGVVAGDAVAVSVKQPFCLMTVVPGSVNSEADMSTGRGIISWQAVESR